MAARHAAALACVLLLGGCRLETRRTVDSADDVRDRAAADAHPCGTPLIDSAGVGALRIGWLVDSVREHCVVLRDTTELRAEGMPVRILAVPVGSDTVEAEIVRGRVWRIAVSQAGLRTADSLGVGTPLERLLTIPGVRGSVGEGELYLLSASRCGLSFRLSAAELRADGWTADRLRRLPSSTVATRVLVVGCGKRGAD